MINNLHVLNYTKQYLLQDIEYIEKLDNVKITRLISNDVGSCKKSGCFVFIWIEGHHMYLVIAKK